MGLRILKCVLILTPLLFFDFTAAHDALASGRERLFASSQVTDAYTRLIFQCKQPVGFKHSLDKHHLTITFDRPFWSNLSPLTSKIGSDVLSAHLSGDGKTLSLTLSDKAVTLRPFISEDFVGLDLVHAAPKSIPDEIHYASGAKAVFEDAAIEEKLPSRFQLAQGDTAKSALEDRIDNALAASKAAKKKAVPAPEETKAEAQPVKETPQAEKPSAAPPTAEDATKAEAPAAPVTTAQTAPTEAKTETKTVTATTEEATQPPAATQQATTLPSSSDSTITFPWPKNVAAAIFKRNDYIWIVFNEPMNVNTASLLKNHEALFDSVHQIENRQNTILYFHLLQELYPIAYKEGTNWTITFSTRKIPPTEPFQVSIENSNLNGSSIKVEGNQFSEPLRITDPIVGNQLMVVPSYEAEAGIGLKHKQTDFLLLPTAQGVALSLISDNVNMEQKQFSVAFAGPTNRITNSESQALRERLEKLKREREAKLKEKLAEEGEQSLLKMHSWAGDPTTNFNKKRQALEAKIMDADWGNKNPFRLDLARFYIANDMEMEALGVIKTLRGYDATYANRNDVLFVEGVANYMAHRFDRAIKDFSAIKLNTYSDLEKEEVRFWLAASQLKQTGQIKMDKFLSSHPLKDEEKDDSQGADKVGITKLILDTSSRLLKMIKQIDPDMANSEEIQTLESTARFVSHHYQEAIKRFEDSDLYHSGDTFSTNDDSQWWNTSGVRQSNTPVNFAYLQDRALFLKYYPDNLFNKFALLSLADRLESNDLSSAERILDTFRETKDPRIQNDITYMKGLYLAKDEEIDQALKAWEPLTKDVFDRYNRARSIFASTDVKMKAGRINTDEAIKVFNNLRMVWRGDVLELNLLKLLGEFYMDKQQYMQAFKTWREVLTNFPGSEDALLIAKKMNQEFVYLFNGDGAKNLSQLDALTLYYEFRELTPVGKQGDQMVLKLVDRLVNVDLLDRAAALLTHLVRFRLTGEDRDQASTRLAEIHLMTHQPEQALDVLNATQDANMAPDLKRKRRYLKVHALIDMKQNNQALSLLRNDDNTQASFLRAEVYWRNKVWRKVIDELEYPFKEIVREERILTPAESNALTKLAIAYALVGDKKRLSNLYEDFIEYVPSQQQKKLLTFIATDNSQTIDYRNLAASIGLDKMQAFLKDYAAQDAKHESGK